MITLSLLKYLEDAGFGKLAVKGNEKGANLFWEKLALDKVGIFITTLGDPIERGSRRSTSFSLYCRGDNDAEGYSRLNAVVEHLSSLETYGGVCTLPEVEGFSREFNNVTIMPMDTVSAVGQDENGRMIWSSTGKIYY